MKKTTIYLFMALIMGMFCVVQSCNILQQAGNSDSVEMQILKSYAVGKLEQVFEVKIEDKPYFSASKRISNQKFERIFGQKINQKITDTCRLYFENQKVRTQLAFYKVNADTSYITFQREKKLYQK